MEATWNCCKSKPGSSRLKTMGLLLPVAALVVGVLGFALHDSRLGGHQLISLQIHVLVQ